MAEVTACSTLAFSLSSLEVALKHISGYGFDRVEISDQVTHSKHFSIDTVDPLEVRKLLEKYSLEPVAANCPLCTFYTGQPGLQKASVEKQSSSETDEIRKAKQDIVFYKLHVKNQAEDYTARARHLWELAGGGPR